MRLLSHKAQIHLNWNLNWTDVDVAGSWEHRQQSPEGDMTKIVIGIIPAAKRKAG